jgi:hypothetical protein
MTTDLLIYGLPMVSAAVAGGTAGAAVAWKLGRPEPISRSVTPEATPVTDDTEFINSEIDLASVRWQEANNLPPEAAGLMATRLKTLHKLGKAKGWF